MSYTDLGEYDSIRVKYATHKLRHSHHATLIESGPGQTIRLSANGAYLCFRIVESGIEFPIGNIASAIPKGSAISGRLQKTTGSRLTTKPTTPAKKTAKGGADADE